MRHGALTFAIFGALTALPPAAVVSPARSRAGQTTGWLITPPSVHALRGMVKSVDANTLVLARTGTRVHDLAFVLSPSAVRTGALVAGATVSVRYRVDGATLVAIGVTPNSGPHAGRLGPVAK